ncbi:MAG: alkaline phosphatase [Bacilli bacterium]|jgi:alkaline phosphatase
MAKHEVFKKIRNGPTIFIIGLFLFSCSQEATKYDELSTIDGYQNAIIMIGDGMGYNHIQVTKSYNESASLYLEEEALISGWVKTKSANSLITDSAAAATAMSSGQKTNNGMIAYRNNRSLTTMAQFAKAYGKGVGIIATETLTGATPAAFSAHNISRGNTDQIAAEQISNNIDVYLGAGKAYYDGKKPAMSENNLSYYTDFAALHDDVNLTINDEQLLFTRFLGSFDTISTIEPSTPSAPTLKDMSLQALNYLSFKFQEQGFFLMIEGSHIDKRAHDKDLVGMINQLNGFNEAVSGVVEWAKQKGETFVMVTADHETGGLQYEDESKSELSDAMFTRSGHSGIDVPFYIYNSLNLSFIEPGETIDNTDIAKIYRAILRN